MRQLIRKIPLSIRRMLPVFIGVFIIVYSFIIIMRYNNYETNNDNDAPDQNIPTTGGGTTETTTMAANKENAQEEEDVPINAKELRRTHIFYYPWYANMETDGAWNHWNHRVLSHWNPETAQKYLRDVNYVPPDDIGCNFYPKLGPYSSMNDEVVMEHMNKLKDYVVVVSWWGRPDVNDAKDGEGYSTDLVMPKLFKAAEKTGAKIAFHLEPYPSRNLKSVKEDLEYIIEKYGKSPALYRDKAHGNRIVVYMYDSYHISPEEWQTILSPTGSDTIRGTSHDALIFGLLLKPTDISSLSRANFDGFYTYFAADGFTGGSKRSNWAKIVTKGKEAKLLASISVGPGYIDTRIRPWNAENTRNREGGKYYTDGLEKALEAKPEYLSITSFNEWHEGTQIEEAVPKAIQYSIENNGKPFTYMDYSPNPPDFYLSLTGKYAEMFEKQ